MIVFTADFSQQLQTRAGSAFKSLYYKRCSLAGPRNVPLKQVKSEASLRVTLEFLGAGP